MIYNFDLVGIYFENSFSISVKECLSDALAVVAETEVMEEAAGEEVLEASNNSLTSRLSWPPASSIPQINLPLCSKHC